MICSPQSDKASSACFLHLQRRAGMALRVAGYHCCCSCCGQPLCSASLLSSSSSPPADKPEWFLPGEPVTVAAAEQGAEVWAQGGGRLHPLPAIAVRRLLLLWSHTRETPFLLCEILTSTPRGPLLSRRWMVILIFFLKCVVGERVFLCSRRSWLDVSPCGYRRTITVQAEVT